MVDSVHLKKSKWHGISLSCQQTFFLILILFLIPFSLLGFMLWRETSNQWHVLSVASSSLAHNKKLSLLLQEVIEHEQLMQRFLLGDHSLHIAMESLQKRIDEQIVDINQTAAFFDEQNKEEEGLSFAHVDLPIDQITNTWRALIESQKSLSLERNLSEHLKIVEAIRACLKILQERIALHIPHDLVTVLLDQVLYLYIPSLQQEMMRFASLGEQMTHLTSPPPNMRHRFIGAMALADYHEDQIQVAGKRAMHLQYVFNMDTTLKTILEGPFSGMHDAFNNWFNEVQHVIEQNGQLSFIPFLLLASHAFEESAQLTTNVMEQMTRLLNERINAWTHTAWSYALLFCLIFLPVFSLACYVLYHILHALKQMQGAAQAMQAGNLQARFPEHVPAELSHLSTLFNGIGSSMQGLLSSLKKMMTTFKESSQTLKTLFEKQNQVLLEQKTANRQLFLHTKALARSVEASLQSLNELFFERENISSSIKQGKDSLQKMAYIIEALLTNGQELTNTLSLVNDHNQNATHLIGNMTQVADRTNLLSLNAAIEAQKMGSGSGLGLIADEVRRLADQTAHTTLDIEQVIHQIMGSMTSSHSSMQHLNEVLKLTSQQIKPFDNVFLMLQSQIDGQLEWLKKLKTQIEEEANISEGVQQTIHLLHDNTQQITQMLQQIHTECARLDKEMQNEFWISEKLE